VNENINVTLLPEERVKDHLDRYRWAVEWAPKRGLIYDLGCGYGYGSHLLAERTKAKVIGIDAHREAITFAAQSYSRPNLMFKREDIEGSIIEPCDMIVCLEVLEHLVDPMAFLRKVKAAAPVVFFSVPIIPTKHRNPYHLHDFTLRQARGWFLGWRLCFQETQDRDRTYVACCKKGGA